MAMRKQSGFWLSLGKHRVRIMEGTVWEAPAPDYIRKKTGACLCLTALADPTPKAKHPMPRRIDTWYPTYGEARERLIEILNNRIRVIEEMKEPYLVD